MKNINRILLIGAAFLVLMPLSASAKKKAKKGKKEAPAAASTPLSTGIQRELCGIGLASVVADPEKMELRDVTEVYKRMLPEGDKMFSAQGKLEPGATGCLVQVFGQTVWRIQATFPPNFTKSHPWDKMAAANTRSFGEPEKTEQKSEKTDKLKLVWKDEKTRLADTRELRGKDSGVDDERNQIYFQIAIEDIALSMRPVKAKD